MQSGTTADGGHGPGAHEASTGSWLVRFAGLERGDLWVVATYSAVIGVLSLVVPVAVQALVTNVGFGQARQPVVALTVGVGLLLGFAGVLKVLQFRVLEFLQRRVLVRVALEAAERLPRARAGETGPATGPDLAHRFFDVVSLQKVGTTLVLDGLELALQLGVGMVLLTLYHPALLGFVVLLVVSIVLVLLAGREGPKTALGESAAKYALVEWLETLARTPEAFKAAGPDGLAAKVTHARVGAWLEARATHFQPVLRQFAGSVAVQAILGTALLGLGGTLVLQRQLTLGQLVAAELIVSAVLASVAKLGKHLEAYYDLLAAAEKIGHLLDVPLERTGGAPTVGDGKPARLLLSDVRLPEAAPGTSFTLEVAPGSRHVVGGPDRTRLAGLAFGLEAPAGGVVLLDGVDLRELSLQRLRTEVALARGEVFAATVAENVSLGRPSVDEARVRRSLALAGLLDRIHALPDGVHTALGSGGAPLGPSEAARLVLARALAGHPRLLVVEDAFHDVGGPARTRLLDALFDPAAPWTLLFLSDAPDAAARATSRVTLAAGRLAEAA